MATSRKTKLKYILERDVALTKHFVAIMSQYTPLKSLRVHCKALEWSCDGIVWLTCWLAFIWIANSKNLYQMQLNMLLGLVLDIILIAVVKAAVRRRRPIPSTSMLTIGPDKFSFPSGHSSRAFLILMFFTNLYPISAFLWMPLIAWSCSVTLSRLIMHRHYILDVTVGILIGILEAVFLKLIWISPELSTYIINFVTEDNLPGGSE